MRSMQRTLLVSIVVLVCLSTAFSQKMTVEQLISKHLNSIGSDSIRAGARSLMVVGTGTQRFTSTADAPVEGRIVIASEAVKLYMGMNMNSPQYPGQQFKFDGKKFDVAITTTAGRDFFGNFIQDNAALLKSGVFVGALSTGWLMANFDSEKGKISINDNTKINGRETIEVDFSPKGGSDLAIKLFFDAETFQHVRSEYRRITSAPQGVMSRGLNNRTADNSGRQNETRLTVTEEFSDFRSKVGLMLPHTYKLTYSKFGSQGNFESLWTFTISDVIVNPKLSPDSFTVEAKAVGD